jgi:hypothetical protein
VSEIVSFIVDTYVSKGLYCTDEDLKIDATKIFNEFSSQKMQRAMTRLSDVNPESGFPMLCFRSQSSNAPRRSSKDFQNATPLHCDSLISREHLR